MKIKRYFAPDIRQAMRMVREEQGPDAVILSNRKVEGGVEIVAARDFDEQLLLDRVKTDSADAESLARAKSDTRRRAEDAFREAFGKTAGAVGAVSAANAHKPVPPILGKSTNTSPRSGREGLSGCAPDERLRSDCRGREVENGKGLSHPGVLDSYRADADPSPADGSGTNSPGPNRDLRSTVRTTNLEDRESASGRCDDLGACASSGAISEQSKQSSPVAEPVAVAPISHSWQDHSAMSAASQPERQSAKPNPDPVTLRDLQRELRQMRRVIDAHLNEAGWQTAASRHPTRLDLLRRLCALGFSKQLSLQLAERFGDVSDADVAWQAVQHVLTRQIPLAEDNLLDYGGVIALVGPTGVGKTTTIAKLAARFRFKHGPRQIALITTDNYRIGAHEQLATYGRILDVPVRAASSVEDLRQFLSSFYDKRLVLIDTAGIGQRDRRLAEQAELFRRTDLPIKSYLVISAASQLRVMQETLESFRGFSPGACILTKLDETAQFGPAISTVVENKLPVAFVCDGQAVPEDLHVARTHLLLNRCFADQSGTETVGAPMRSYEDWIVHANV